MSSDAPPSGSQALRSAGLACIIHLEATHPRMPQYRAEGPTTASRSLAPARSRSPRCGLGAPTALHSSARGAPSHFAPPGSASAVASLSAASAPESQTVSRAAVIAPPTVVATATVTTATTATPSSATAAATAGTAAASAPPPRLPLLPPAWPLPFTRRPRQESVRRAHCRATPGSDPWDGFLDPRDGLPGDVISGSPPACGNCARIGCVNGECGAGVGSSSARVVGTAVPAACSPLIHRLGASPAPPRPSSSLPLPIAPTTPTLAPSPTPLTKAAGVGSAPTSPPPGPSSSAGPYRRHSPASRPRRTFLPFPLPLLPLLLTSALAFFISLAAARINVRVPDGIATEIGNTTLRALYPNHSWHVPVESTDIPRGSTRASRPHVPFVQVQSDEDQLRLYDENLELDLAPWRRRNRSEVTVAALLKWAARLPLRASQRLVLLQGGRLAVLRQPSNDISLRCERPCDPLLEELLIDLRAWIAQSPTQWPDVVFFLNVADTSLCEGKDAGSSSGGGARTPLGRCPAPVLSLIKEWHRNKDEDILVPVTVGMHDWPPLHYFPWTQKIDRAVFRGREYCHTRGFAYAKDVCSRTYMAHMTQSSPDWSRLLDVGLVDNYTYRAANGTAFPIVGRGLVAAQELARFRYVLALDGITASSRLARLLSLNSVVLKQTSPWIEWYYRSLVPGTHYVTIWNHHRSDVLHAVKFLRHKGRYLYDIATNGQAFAYRYLSPDARRLYWLRTLREYGKLFSDMEEFVTSQVVPEPDDSSPPSPASSPAGPVTSEQQQ